MSSPREMPAGMAVSGSAAPYPLFALPILVRHRARLTGAMQDAVAGRDSGGRRPRIPRRGPFPQDRAPHEGGNSMSKPPLPEAAVAMLSKPNRAVIATV